MEKIKIQIVKLGRQRYDNFFKKLKKYKSKIFNVEIVEAKIPDSEEDWTYSYKAIENELDKVFDNNYHLCIGFIDGELEDNYFSNSLNDKFNKHVVSFYEVDELLDKYKSSVFNYMLLNIYDCITQFMLQSDDITHDETRGCLFDMCGDKSDIIFSSNNLIICEECFAKISSLAGAEYALLLTKEIRRIHKPMFYKIRDFIKGHPILSIAVASISTIALNLISNSIYDLIKLLFK